jgi:hypothetical protein
MREHDVSLPSKCVAMSDHTFLWKDMLIHAIRLAMSAWLLKDITRLMPFGCLFQRQWRLST